jgi:hypothetical protein
MSTDEGERPGIVAAGVIVLFLTAVVYGYLGDIPRAAFFLAATVALYKAGG